MDRPSLWQVTADLPQFPRLDRDTEVDVAVIGAGVSGLTAALLLARAGKTVAVLEARRIGEGETGHTTAHLTELLDARYHTLAAKFGNDGAALAARSSRDAIDQIERLAEGGAGFARVPAYLAARDARQRQELEHELESLVRFGADAAWTDALPVPLPFERAIRVERQAQLHPVAYLERLVSALDGAGARVFERSRVLEVHDGDPCTLSTEEARLRARDVLVLTNHPMSTRYFIHPKIAPYRTYAIAAGPLPAPPPAGLVFDMEDPYHYIRTQETRDGTFLVIGGQDHKTGHGRRSAARFGQLEALALLLAPGAPVRHRWSGQIIEPADGLPYIGRSPGAERIHVGTGYSGTGITFGTLAGMILSDAVLGVANPYAELYAAARVKPFAQAARFLAENVDFPATLAKDRLRRGEVGRVEDVAPGEGRILRAEGKTLAVARDEDGTVHVRSAVCPHLGCQVRWNDAERSWDCPCHGSRFEAAGDVLNGPAARALSEEDAPGAEDEAPARG